MANLTQPVVFIYGAEDSFGEAASALQTASGHPLSCTPVAGWGFGAGEMIFYTVATPDGQIVLSTVPLTSNELQPTMDHAEIDVFDPARMIFQQLIIPTDLGATTTVKPGEAIGGTDVGGGDIRVVTYSPGVQKVIYTSDLYYFGWSIPADGLYPAIGFLHEVSGDWVFDSAASLTGDQWEATNPTAFAVLAPAGQLSGNGASYYSPSYPNQMAVLPSGNVVIGHYFGPSGEQNGCISVVSPAGTLLAAYQIPAITPLSGTLTSANPRDIEADPTGVTGDERFLVLYDAFGTGIHATFQEFTFDSTTATISPVSEPCTVADDDSVGQYAIYGPDGTLYVSCSGLSNGLSARNMNVYLKHTDGRYIATRAPFTSWSGTWPTPVQADYSLGFTVAQGLGFAGPMAIDTAKTGAVLLTSADGYLGATIPDPSVASATPVDGQQFGFTGTSAADLGWTGYATSVSLFTLGEGVTYLEMQAPFNAGIAAIGPEFAVTPNQEYNVVATLQAVSGTPGQLCTAQLQFNDASGNALPRAAANLPVTDAGTGFSTAQGAACAPSDAATGQVVISCATTTAGQGHYLVSCQVFAQPFYTVSPVEMGLAALEANGWKIFITRPCISGRVLYQPLGNGFTSAQQAAYSSAYVPDTAHPQFLAGVNIDQLLAPPQALPPSQRYYPPGVRKVYWLSSVASGKIPTRAELDAGTDVSAEILSMTGFALSAAAVETPDIVSRFVSSYPSAQSLEQTSVTFYASSDEADIRQVIRLASAGYLVVLWEGDNTGGFMDVFPVWVAAFVTDTALSDAGQIEVTFAATKSPAQGVPIPA